MATKKCNQEAVKMIVNPVLDELDQLHQTTVISDTCSALLPDQRKMAADVAQVLYPAAFSGEKGKEFQHHGNTFQATISRKRKYPKRSKNPEVNALLKQLYDKEKEKANLNEKMKQLTIDINGIKNQLDPKMKVESITYSVSVKSK